MTVRTPDDLKAQMAISQTPAPGKVYAVHLHDIVDTLKFLTDSPVITITNASHAATIEQDRARFVFNSGTPVSLTIPSNAPVGWQCLVMQYGAGDVTIVASGGALRSRENHTKTAGLNAQAYLWVAANAGNAPQVALSGDTTV